MTHLGDAGVRRRIVSRIQKLEPETPRQWGRMSAHQMICHLADSFRVGTGEKRVSPASGPLQRTLMKWAALYLPVAWPKDVPTRPEVDQICGGTRPVDFEQDREMLLDAIDRFADRHHRFYGRCHPIFGPMSDCEWLRWGYLHADHHLRQFGI
jgi:hypothetical protein